MELTKNKKHQYLFFLIIIFISIFNGGNSNLLIQLNFILWSLIFFYCLKDKNYNSHLKIFIKENKNHIYIFVFFIFYLVFQLIPFPLDILKILSKEKYKELGANAFEFSKGFSWEKIIKNYINLI